MQRIILRGALIGSLAFATLPTMAQVASHGGLGPARESYGPPAPVLACDAQMDFLKKMDKVCQALDSYTSVGNCYQKAFATAPAASQSVSVKIIAACGDDYSTTANCLKSAITVFALPVKKEDLHHCGGPKWSEDDRIDCYRKLLR